ncbi:juvenile hormone esterase isoform X2 [Halyomorpha halys]
MFSGQGVSGQEDCLYLNVFTPNTTARLPVLFSIHPGGFYGGSAGLFGSANFFMDEDVVFVAPNYRVGTLGFLSLEDNNIPGNMGLKDQALALEWTYREISAFGGDPKLITVIGESAGGESSNAICSITRTNGLIKGCISQSGNAWKPWSYQKPGLAREKALNLVRAVGCEGSENYLKCLQGKPVELVGNMSLLSNEYFQTVAPVMEPATAPGAIMTVWPPANVRSYPWIVGLCQDDGMLVTSGYEYKEKSQQEIDQFINDFNKTVIRELYLENRTEVIQKIRERFFTNGLQPLRAIRNFYTEYLFMYPTLKGLSIQGGPNYLYKFNYTGGPSMSPGETKDIGVGHGAEMPYFFEMPFKVPGWPSAADLALSKQLIKMWVNFARDQNPTRHGEVKWLQFQNKYYLDIQNSGISVAELNKYKEVIDFWKNILTDQPSKSSMSSSSSLFIVTLSIFTVFKGLFP